MYLFYFFITEIGLLLGYYELNYAYIRESLTLIFLQNRVTVATFD